jgi:hypothetical protein
MTSPTTWTPSAKASAASPYSAAAILRSIDFKKFYVHVVSVEHRVPQREAMMALMREQNFELIKSMGSDLLFLNRRSPLYPAYDRLRSE